MMVKFPEEHLTQIQTDLVDGKRLIVCMCAHWCNSCQGWLTQFAELAKMYADDCFVWLDIDEHPDMVAEVNLETLPVLLIQREDEVLYLGEIRPQTAVMNSLLKRDTLCTDLSDPGIRDFLLEPCYS